ncbi:hypothetical protein JRO89_XS07G0114000 [Xanthoceras sorbifolium]|uniref:DRBM domain-containing protein n=1 Tax=Xanthoceras sorbifolium TaxID=99658 RepID=A0ABQ8HTP4_9ROSI|nr:hypothetical protein JRO89_XS07G0114000 [Xanthoceras sorbifolium]
MFTPVSLLGVSNCYVFKSRLQEYAQKVGLPTPVYETTKEGLSHEPSFRSQVTVNDITYKSLPGFFNRKAAEQSAAEVALMELAKCGEVKEHISQPIVSDAQLLLYEAISVYHLIVIGCPFQHETGLCKNLVQEYAQKMNYAIPIYQCQKVEATDNEPGRLTRFCCTVEIGGMRYIGGAARTKKEAEIKAARTALLAIQTSTPESSGKPVGNSQFTVIPCKKRAMESANKLEETVSVPKAKKARFLKKMSKRRISGDKTIHTQIEGSSNLVFAMGTHQEGSEGDQTNAHGVQVEGSAEATKTYQEGRSDVEPIDGDITTQKGTLTRHTAGDSQNVQSNATDSNQSNHKEPDLGKSPIPCGDIPALTKEMNETTGIGEMASMVTLGHVESSCAIAGISQPQERIQTSASQV